MRGGEGNAAWQRCEERRILRLLAKAFQGLSFSFGQVVTYFSWSSVE